MDKYLVGGCVRDKYLGLPVKDRDWVVVGASVDDMLQHGYQQVGKDFPVFLHPRTKEEHALARTERKTAPGYTGFEFHADPNVTLEQDLQRRDLTINAMAETEDGRLVDPYGGKQDLDNRILRHVSPAFVEDPVRILRLARFAARFAQYGFVVADETMDLMKQMVADGEVDALVPERVWQETERALGEATPGRFIEVLRRCGALQRIFPEIANLFGVPQSAQHHPEVDTGIHTMMVLTQAARLSADTRVRFAALVHDLGKGTTPKDILPKHIGHEEGGVPLVEGLCDRLKVPREYRDLGVMVARYHLFFHRAGELNASTFLKLFKNLDAYRRPERYELFLLACEADARGRPGYEERDFDQPRIMRRVYEAAARVDGGAVAAEGYSGKAVADELHRRRMRAVKQAMGALPDAH